MRWIVQKHQFGYEQYQQYAINMLSDSEWFGVYLNVTCECNRASNFKMSFETAILESVDLVNSFAIFAFI